MVYGLSGILHLQTVWQSADLISSDAVLGKLKGFLPPDHAAFANSVVGAETFEYSQNNT